MRKSIAVLLLLTLLLSLSGCGSSGNNAAAEEKQGVVAANTENGYAYKGLTGDAADVPEAPELDEDLGMAPDKDLGDVPDADLGDVPDAEPAGGEADAKGKKAAKGEDPGNPYQNAQVKLIRRATLNLETRDFDAAVAGLEKLVADMGGYVEESNLNQGNYGSTYRSASYTVRIPSKKYSDFLNQLSADERCHLVDKDESTEDVGQAYFDTEARLKTLRTKLKRLQKLLEQAEKMKDIITLEDAISETEYEIDQYASTLNRYDSLIGFSTIQVSLSQVNNLSDTDTIPYLTRLGNAFAGGLKGFGLGFQNLLLWLAGNLLTLLVLAVIALLIVRLVRRRRRKKRAEEQGDGKKLKTGSAPKQKQADPERKPEDQSPES